MPELTSHTLLTIGQQLRKHLGSSDETVNIIPAVLPFNATVGVEAFVFHPVELLVANLPESPD